tara:strand:- start:5430 stop:10223 length:4794 start_codon:yes stop_codon:yes gene_type:complete
VARQQAPKGGVRYAGKFYKGGQTLPKKYSYGTPDSPTHNGSTILTGVAGTRLVDPAAHIPEVAPNYGRPIVPHVSTFQGMITSLAKAYRYSDEALQHSKANAHMMLNDPAITEPLFSRMRITSQLNWHIEPEDENDEAQIKAAEVLTMLMKKIPNFAKYRFALLLAVWYGRYAIENQYGVTTKNGRKYYYINKWTPLSGDKLLFRYDDGSGKYDPDQIGIRMSPALVKEDHIAGRYELEPTYDTLAYFLKPWERKAMTVHRHILMDAEYESPIDGGMIHGVGLRNFLYWAWYQKQEAQAMVAEMVERSAMGFTIYYYPDGNAAAQEEVEKIASEQAHTNVITMPRGADGSDSYGIDQIPPNSAGIQILQDYIQEFCNRQIKLMIMGQTLSSEPGSTGMGSGVAGLQKNTLADIISFDANGLEETVTSEMLVPLRDFNMPEMRDVDFKFRIDTESSDPLKDLQGLRQAWEMGAKIREQDVHDIIGTSAPGEGDTTLYNPVLMQQTRLAEESIQGSDGEDSALTDLMGGSEEEEDLMNADELSPKAESVSSNLISSFYGQNWADSMGGGDDPGDSPTTYGKDGKPVKYGYGQSFDELEHPRAPKGGITLNGKEIKGGVWIEDKDLAGASPEELDVLEQSQVGDEMEAGNTPADEENPDIDHDGDPDGEGGYDDPDNDPDGGDDKPDDKGGDTSDEQVEPMTDEQTKMEQAERDADLVDFVAQQFGKPLQHGSGKFLMKQAMMLQQAGFNIKIPDSTYNASEVAIIVAHQMESLAGPMNGIVQASKKLGLTQSKAQGLLYRVNHASNQLLNEAESKGYTQKSKNFRDQVTGSLDYLSKQGVAAIPANEAADWGKVAAAALKLTGKVMNIPMATALGGLLAPDESDTPEGYEQKATEFLSGLRDDVVAWKAQKVIAPDAMGSIGKEAKAEEERQKGNGFLDWDSKELQSPSNVSGEATESPDAMGKTDLSPEAQDFMDYLGSDEEGTFSSNAGDAEPEAEPEPEIMPIHKVKGYSRAAMDAIGAVTDFQELTRNELETFYSHIADIDKQQLDHYNSTTGTIVNALRVKLEGQSKDEFHNMRKEAAKVLEAEGDSISGLDGKIQELTGDPATAGAFREMFGEGADGESSFFNWLANTKTLPKPPQPGGPETIAALEKSDVLQKYETHKQTAEMHDMYEGEDAEDGGLNVPSEESAIEPEPGFNDFGEAIPGYEPPEADEATEEAVTEPEPLSEDESSRLAGMGVSPEQIANMSPTAMEKFRSIPQEDEAEAPELEPGLESGEDEVAEDDDDFGFGGGDVEEEGGLSEEDMAQLGENKEEILASGATAGDGETTDHAPEAIQHLESLGIPASAAANMSAEQVNHLVENAKSSLPEEPVASESNPELEAYGLTPEAIATMSPEDRAKITQNPPAGKEEPAYEDDSEYSDLRDMAKGSNEPYYDSIMDSLTSKGKVPSAERKSDVGQSWDMLKHKLRPEEFVQGLRDNGDDIRGWTRGLLAEDDFGDEDGATPFAKQPEKRVQYTKLATKAHLDREDLGYEDDAEQNLNCGNCDHFQAGRCLKFDSMNRSNPTKYDLDSEVDADAGCDLYQFKVTDDEEFLEDGE